MKSKVLFVDDDIEFLRAIEFALAGEFELCVTGSFNEAELKLRNQSFDLVVMDYDLGARSAECLLALVNSTTPVLIVTGKADKDIAVRLLNKRVHGLIEKPLTSKILLEKMNSLLIDNNRSAQEEIAALMLTIVRDQRKVIMGEESVLLTPTELKIFDILLEGRGRKIQREDLCKSIWGNMSLSKNTLDTHLSNLKKKLPILNEKLKVLYGSGVYLDI